MILTGKEPTIPTPFMLRTNNNGPWWADVLIRQKRDWMKTGKFKGDLPPIIIPMRGNSVIGYVVTPDLDKHLGLEAASLIRKVMDLDSIVFVADGHMPIGDYAKKMETEFLAGKYRNGDMQRIYVH